MLYIVLVLEFEAKLVMGNGDDGVELVNDLFL